MKEEALALVRDLQDPAQRLNLLREYLQACVLRSLHESEAFLCLSLVGGTALRFLFDLPRFSEDLDFSLMASTGYEPTSWLKKLERDMSMAGFDLNVRWNERTTVHKAWIRAAGILEEAGLANMAEQKLSIKLEIDTRPPEGGVTQRAVVNRHRIFALQHHDLPSLMAGKIHALVTRQYSKGRDWYDLLWYRARRPPVEPNLAALQNALDQTQGAGKYDAKEWMTDVRNRLSDLDTGALQDDVAPFLEHRRDAEMLTGENLLSVLE